MSKTQTPQEPIHSRKIKVLAEVQLDDEQKIATGHSLVDEMAVRDRKEDDFKVMREFHKGEIKALDTRIMELRSEINTGRGTREIEAEEFFFWDLGKVKTQRTTATWSPSARSTPRRSACDCRSTRSRRRSARSR